MSKAETLRRLRLGDLKIILRSRCGHTLPDDDAGREYLELLLDVVSFVPDARHRMKNIIETWAPWMDTAAAYELVEAVLRKPEYLRKTKAARLGEQLNLTYEERQKQRIRTIAPADLSPEEFAERRRACRRARQRENQRRRRRKTGAKPRVTYLTTALSRRKPWLLEGISRATWYRMRVTDGETARETSVKANKLLDRSVTDLSQSVPVESKGNSRKEVAEEVSSEVVRKVARA